MKATKPCLKCGREKPLADYPFRRGAWGAVCRECTYAGIRDNDRTKITDENGNTKKRRRQTEFRSHT